MCRDSFLLTGQLTGGEAQRLADDEQWRASRFGRLEDFIFDFLVSHI